jgi:hypothetical protein
VDSGEGRLRFFFHAYDRDDDAGMVVRTLRGGLDDPRPIARIGDEAVEGRHEALGGVVVARRGSLVAGAVDPGLPGVAAASRARKVEVVRTFLVARPAAQ